MLTLDNIKDDYFNKIPLEAKISFLKNKTVKVYKNVRTKFGYEGDARIEKVNRQISDHLYNCDLSFPDDFFTATIDINDVLF